MADPVPFKDLEQEKKKEQEQVELEAKAIKKSSFANVPIIFKALGILLLVLKYSEVSKRGGNLAELWIWVIIVGVAWYMLGMEAKLNTSGILSPKEAYDCITKEISIMRKDNRIKYNKNVTITPVQNLATHEAIPTYYIFSLVLTSVNGVREKYKAMVSAKGETKGFVYITETPIKVRGDEVEHTKMIVNKEIKNMQKYPELKGIFGFGNR